MATFLNAKLKKRFLLASNEDRKIFHLILETDLFYNPGDAIAVIPKNDPAIVKKIIDLCNYRDVSQNSDHLYEILLKKNISKLTTSLFKEVVAYSENEYLKSLLEDLPDGVKSSQQNISEKSSDLSTYLQNHELLDFLEESKSKIPVDVLSSKLSPILPRMYSIASSKKVVQNELHLLVVTVTYETSNIKRFGVATHFLCDLIEEGEEISFLFHQNKKFHLDQERPIIMIGAGTGLAPFIGFLQERFFYKIRENWLFFGERKRSDSFFFENFLRELEEKSFLKLDTAFSRDQEKKIYVQDKILENSKKFVSWIDRGAIIYICGSAKLMANSVHKALTQIFQKEKGFSEADAEIFIQKLIADGRYKKDVY